MGGEKGGKKGGENRGEKKGEIEGEGEAEGENEIENENEIEKEKENEIKKENEIENKCYPRERGEKQAAVNFFRGDYRTGGFCGIIGARKKDLIKTDFWGICRFFGKDFVQNAKSSAAC